MARNGTSHEPGFHVFATQAANLVGTKWAFLAALLVIALWLVSGPYFHYSDTSQLTSTPAPPSSRSSWYS